MGKKNPSDADLNSAIHDLGGDADDIKLVADADFSGSDYEDSASKSGDNTNLADDVAKMWKELSGGTDATSSGAKPSKKKVFDDNGSKSEPKPGKKETPNSSNETKKESKNESKNEVRDTGKPTINKQDTRTDSRKEVKKDPKNRDQTKSRPVAEPKREQPVPKKVRQAWDQYLSTLDHPRSLLVDGEKHWYETTSEEVKELPNFEFVEALKAKAQILLDTENQVYFKERMNDREFTTSLEFLKSGTFSDQLGTLSILSTESPLHSVRFLENLANKCEIKNRESACKALEVTKDLLVSHVLPNRRLRFFKDQPVQLGIPAATLIAWSYEDFLKRYFFRILRVMEVLLSDTVENIRTRTLHCVFAFFQEKPEQEANLLRLGLNKLGDPAGKVASRVKRLLMDVLQKHPGMKSIVASAMNELLGRVSDYRTRYYAVDTLSEFILSNRDPALANQLIYIYLGLFERLLNETNNKKDERVEKPVSNSKPKNGKRIRAKRGKKGGIQQASLEAGEVEAQQHARLVAKIFTGLNRAFPFSNLDPKVFSKYTDTLYHMSHSPNVGTFIEALSFIFQLSKAAPKSSGGDRYYRALYDSLLDNRLPRSSKLGKYMHLLLRSFAELKSEEDIACSNAFTKRSLQVACNVSEVGAVASLIHVANLAPNSSRLVERENVADTADEYDSKKRDPRYAKAETSHAWETLLLQQHFHPTVALYANNLLATDAEKQALDMPDIEQYSVNSFLSKWSYKKPKAKESNRGGSIFQPLAGFTDLTLGIRQQKKIDELPASMQDWKNRATGDIAPEERFLYEYFSQKPEKKVKKQPDENAGEDQDGADDSDAESIGEDEINEAMSRSGPADLGGADINASDMDEDSEEDGDLEDDLANAFNSDLDDEDEDEGEEDGDEGEEESEGEPADGNADIKDDFADFDGIEARMDVQAGDDDEKDGKKRKRGWSKYPTFLDMDAFEKMYPEGEEESSKKRR